MTKNLPNEIRIKVKEVVYRLADEFGYMNKSRVDSGVFMENLAKNPEVGGVLAEFMEKGLIKTYIKDAVLNRYMKDKKHEVLPTCSEFLLPTMQKVLGCKALVIEEENPVFLFRLENGALLLVSQGTFLKWETALRKALEFIAKAPALPPDGCDFHILLNIALLGESTTLADRNQLRKALDLIGVGVNFADCED